MSSPLTGSIHSAPAALPAERVNLRAGAIADRAMVRMISHAAVKDNAFPSSSGHSRGMSNLRTRLRVEAWVRNGSYVKHLWVDAHVLGRDAVILQRRTVPLTFTHAAGDGGDLFGFDGFLYQGSIATQGSVDPRPDARTVQYRLYCEQAAELFTDGVTHQCALREDAVSG